MQHASITQALNKHSFPYRPCSYSRFALLTNVMSLLVTSTSMGPIACIIGRVAWQKDSRPGSSNGIRTAPLCAECVCPAIYHPGHPLLAAVPFAESWHPQEKPAAVQLTNQHDKKCGHVRASHTLTHVQQKQFWVTLQISRDNNCVTAGSP